MESATILKINMSVSCGRQYKALMVQGLSVCRDLVCICVCVCVCQTEVKTEFEQKIAELIKSGNSEVASSE